MNETRIEGLSSLKSLSLRVESFKPSSYGNLNGLRRLSLAVKGEIDNDMIAKLFEICPHIEELSLGGQFSNINFDSFISLKMLGISGSYLEDFNFDILTNICNQLEELSIGSDLTI